MKLKNLLIVSLLLSSVTCFADEGMWMVNAIDKALEKRMKQAGCKLPAKMIYDEEKGGLSDAIVSLSFGCSGSIISDEGLMITNHHCAYADIFSLSTLEHNYLEDGFWARRRSDELPVKSDGVYFLRKVLDITEEAVQIRDSHCLKGKAMGMRKLSHMLENKYKELFPGQEVSLYSMYAGEKYYIMVYDVFKDVRLVAAPPACIASFGAEVDNWEWPQQKGDFAIYRIYTAPDGSPAEYSKDNVPMHSRRKLTVSTKGIKEGDYTMIMGYPGTTNRFSSSYEIQQKGNLIYPISAKLGKERMAIMNKWMNSSPDIRLKYSDQFFMLSNVQEIREGESECIQRHDVVRKVAQTRDKYVPQDLLDSLKYSFELGGRMSAQTKYFQETGVRSGNLFKLSMMVKKGDKQQIRKFLAGLDLNVEKEIFILNITEINEHIDSAFRSPFLNEIITKYSDAEVAARMIWATSALSTDDPASINVDDPVVKLYSAMSINAFNKAREIAEGKYILTNLRNRYKIALYKAMAEEGTPLYPDANSSMRLTYGKVTDLRPQDAVIRLSHTTTTGILEKYNPNEYIFNLKPEILNLYKEGNWGASAAADGTMWVNFITTNDITGGNSGSPVMNAKGELVGLAFDGNKEGLACDVYYDSRLNRTVCVDIRYIMWILDKYAGMHDLIDEIMN